MLKRNIKIILIGLLVLGFFGLIYSFLSSKPEIVSDTSMRSNEPVPPVPTLARNVSDELVDIDPVVSAVDTLEQPSDVQAPVVVLGASEVEASDEVASTVSVDVEASDPEPISSDIAEVLAEAEESAHTDGQPDQDESAQEEQGAGPMLAVDSDVDVLPEQSGFLDLNMTETTAIDLKLIEGDDLILDDINEDLTKYQAVVATVATNLELVPEASEPIDIELGSAASGTTEAEVAETSGLASGETPEPAVVSIPAPDDELMNGVGELSEQYRETYAKLQLVTTKLSRADEKNKALKSRFVDAADQNREMDEKINLINQKIIELTTK